MLYDKITTPIALPVAGETADLDSCRVGPSPLKTNAGIQISLATKVVAIISCLQLVVNAFSGSFFQNARNNTQPHLLLIVIDYTKVKVFFDKSSASEHAISAVS